MSRIWRQTGHLIYTIFRVFNLVGEFAVMQSNHLMVKSDMNYNNYKACKINLSLNIYDTPIFLKLIG